MKPLPDPSNNRQSSQEDVVEMLSDEDFELQIKETQSALRGYIISIMGQGDDVDDVLQETNIFLWDHRQDFQAGTNFKGWSFKIAYFKAMSSRRSRIRRGEVVFSPEITHRISAEAGSYFDERSDQLLALRRCLSDLKSSEIQLIKIKYQERKKLTDYAKETEQSTGVLQKTISRIRLRLRSCIEKQLSNNNQF